MQHLLILFDDLYHIIDDTDECISQNPGCSPHATCQNKPGKEPPTCLCNAGYEGDGKLCEG